MKPLPGILFCILSVISLAFLAGCSKPGIGLAETGLRPCPGSPNCVSSQAKDEGHFIEPLNYGIYGISPGAAHDILEKIVSSQDGASLVLAEPDYIHAEFRTKIFGFVDDVEFWFPRKQGLIHIRSASRLGYSDFGVNKKRVEMLRQMFAEQASILL